MTTLQLLRKARALVERGWIQHHSYEGEAMQPTSVCLVAATSFAAWDQRWLPENIEAETVADELIATAIGTDDAVGWNDTEGRTQAEVLAAIDRAIELAKAVS